MQAQKQVWGLRRPLYAATCMMAEQRAPRVGVIGAGISGVLSAAHMIEAGVDVTVFERLSEPGGVWVFDDRRPIDPVFPSMLASKGEMYLENGRLDLEHSPPGPCYLGLTNNVSTRLLQTKVGAFPSGTPDFVHHSVIKEYIQSLARTAGVDRLTLYGARVTDVRKVDDVWRLTYTTLHHNPVANAFSSLSKEREFDALVVASGHYHAPRVPDISGLKDWKSMWPTRVWHSKSYRKPDEFRDKNVLLVGAGTSSTDIAKELGPFARTIYQSSRGGRFDFSATLLPENGVRVGAIASFDGGLSQNRAMLLSGDPLPHTVTLKDGQQLCNLDFVIVCTGYHITFPFLSSFHEDNTPVEEASDTVLVTDGRRVHNLHRHLFYIPDPTLAFIGLPYHVSTFNIYDFQAIAVAAVFSGRVSLPSEGEMREEYRNALRLRGGDRDFHSLGGDEIGYVQPLLDWLNKDAVLKGQLVVSGHTEEWHVAKAEHMKRIAPFFDQLDPSAAPKPTVDLPRCS